MSRTSFKDLLDAGAHFGHLKRKWNPNMAPYIFMERNGIHIIDLHKTVVKIDEAASSMKQIVKSGRKILFVATKKQAKDIVAEKVQSINMPYITERWSGGMLTNFPTIRKAVKKMTGKTVIDSIRNLEEIKYLRENTEFLLLSIDAPPEIRFQRARKRGRREPLRTLNAFMEMEKREMTGNKKGQQLRKCMESADFKITNQGTLKEFHRKLYHIKLHALIEGVLNIIMPFAEFYLRKGYPSMFLFSLFKLHKALIVCSKTKACHYFD